MSSQTILDYVIANGYHVLDSDSIEFVSLKSGRARWELWIVMSSVPEEYSIKLRFPQKYTWKHLNWEDLDS